MRADPRHQTGGPVRLSVDALRDLVDILCDAPAVAIAAFGLEDASLEPDPFLVEREWARVVEAGVKQLWIYLSLFDPDCEID